MDLKENKTLFVKKNESIYNVLKSIDESALGIAIIIGKSNEFIGIATDGDIRRSLLQGNNLDDSILKAANTDPIIVYDSDPREYALSLLSKKMKLIPVLDNNKKVIDVLTIKDIDFGLDIYKRRVCVLGLG